MRKKDGRSSNQNGIKFRIFVGGLLDTCQLKKSLIIEYISDIRATIL